MDDRAALLSRELNDAYFGDPLYADERECVVDDEPTEPEYICSNGHTFDKTMRRYADVFCPVCGTKEVGRNREPD